MRATLDYREPSKTKAQSLGAEKKIPAGVSREKAVLSSNTAQMRRPAKKKSWIKQLFSYSWTKELRRLRRGNFGRPATKEQIFAAVNRLMIRGLKYDAIRLLYTLEYYREAADILRAIGATSDAARLYVKAKCWDQAEQSYTVLQDKLNAARCAKAAGRYDRAAPVFEEHNEPHLAARCYRRMGEWRKAALLYGLAGRFNDSIRCWHEWVRLDRLAVETALSTQEVNVLIRLMSEGKFETVLFQLIDFNGKVSELVFALMKRNRMSMAAEIYDSRYHEISKDLCAWVRVNPDMAGPALSLCQLVNDSRGIANLYEQTDRLHQAVEAYETIGDLQAAYACALKCEWWDKIAALKVKIAKDEKQGASAVAENVFRMPEPELNLDALNDILNMSLMSNPSAVCLDSSVFSLSAIEHSVANDSATEVLQNIPELPVSNQAFGIFESTGSSIDMAPAFVESRFFNQLNSDDRHRLWDIGAIVSYKAGDIIVDIGTTPSSTFTLLQGNVEIYRQEGRLERLIDKVGSGQNFGESWLMVNLKSEVRIIAADDCHLHVIERGGFEQFLAADAMNTARIVSQVAQAICMHLLHRFGAGMAKPKPKPVSP